jgi:hypothetical protein
MMRFGDYLIEKDIISREDLDVALKFQTEKSLRLGALAVEDGLLTEAAVKHYYGSPESG